MNKEDAVKVSFKNRKAVENSKHLGCYSCIRVFDKSEIEEWVDNEETAICPHCWTDALLPDVSDLKFLEECNIRWFTGVSVHTPLQNQDMS